MCHVFQFIVVMCVVRFSGAVPVEYLNGAGYAWTNIMECLVDVEFQAQLEMLLNFSLTQSISLWCTMDM